MFRRLVLAVAIACSLFVPSPRVGASLYSVPAAEQAKECVVHVTRTGYRYHQSWCRYLRYSDIPMSRTKALGAGYTPCRVCGGSDCE
jgi:hypothetical protein